MREAYVLHISDQFVGQFAVRVGLGVVVFAPRAKVHLVYAHRQLKRILSLALLEPSLIAPRKAARVPDDGCVLRCLLKESPHRVGLEQQLILRVDQLELIVRPLPYLRHKPFPHTGIAQATHFVPAAIPVVKVANHAHTPGIRRPDGKRRALNAVNLTELRT